MVCPWRGGRRLCPEFRGRSRTGSPTTTPQTFQAVEAEAGTSGPTLSGWGSASISSAPEGITWAPAQEAHLLSESRLSTHAPARKLQEAEGDVEKALAVCLGQITSALFSFL